MNLYGIVIGLIVVTLLAVSLSRLRQVRTKADYLVAVRARCWLVPRTRIATDSPRCGRAAEVGLA